MGCEEWLLEVLKDGGPHLCDEIRTGARKAGYSRANPRRARKELGIKTFHQFDEDGETPNWFWYLGE